MFSSFFEETKSTFSLREEDGMGIERTVSQSLEFLWSSVVFLIFLSLKVIPIEIFSNIG
ncbi:MAG: hypothetical protein OXK80_06770 [Bdellovibrionales bacterium]|nr:hypothetical protein [Bdellovibrionales bacterium]